MGAAEDEGVAGGVDAVGSIPSVGGPSDPGVGVERQGIHPFLAPSLRWEGVLAGVEAFLQG